MKHLIKRTSVGILGGVLCTVLICANAWAQSTAQISGAVRDQTGAVLPGVEVTATQTDTGLVRNAVSDETGSYGLTNLPIGPYRLDVSLPGFRTYVQTGIVLQVGSNPVINAVLEVGQVSDQIEVQADAALVETRSTGVGQVMDNVRVLELPLNGRQVTELLLLSGAATLGTVSKSDRYYPTTVVSVAGGMDNGLSYLLDGGTHNDPMNNLNMPLPFPDALQEFKVETSAVPAQYGHHSAGVVNAVTKSGTNEMHGSLFEFVRNKVFNARNAFAVTRDGLKRNQFGGTLGGPIVKSKLFYFGAYQGTIERSEPTDNRQYVPTAAMLAGDWTAVTSPACNGGRQIALRAPFANNRIDPSLFSTPSINLVTKFLPKTTDPCGEVRFGRRANSDEKVLVGKVDYQRSEKHSLFARYQYNDLFQPSNYDGQNVLSYSISDIKRRVQSAVVGDTYLIGNGTVSSFRATFGRTFADKISDQYFEENPLLFSTLGVKGITELQAWKFYRITVSGGFSGSFTTPGYTNSTIFQFAEDVSSVKGSHQIGLGANYIRSFLNVSAGSASNGMFGFDATNTGLGLGDFMLGRAASWNQQGFNAYYFRQNYIGLYLQDTWKASSRLTVNAGVRWEPFMPFRDKRGRSEYFNQKNFDQGIRSTQYTNAPAGLVFSGDPDGLKNGALSNAHWLHFAPRLGLAWDPEGNGRMTVRAAYGIFFDFPHFYQFNSLRDAPPWGYEVNIENPPGGFEFPWQGYPGGNPFPVTLNKDIRFPVSGTYLSIPPDLKMPYLNQWNLSVQRQVGSAWLLSANYVGNNVVHLMDIHEGNPAIYLPGASCVLAGRTFSPCSTTSNIVQRRRLSLQDPEKGQFYGNLVVPDDGGTRSYNGMLLSIQHRRSNGLTVQGNYTWSHCLDDGTQVLFQNNGGETAERRGANRGNCASDKRHNVNLSTVYEMPRFSGAAMRAVFSGWKVSGILKVQSGNYITVASGRDTALTGTLDRRPDQVLANQYVENKSAALWLNPAAFAQPANGTYGNVGNRNALSPGSFRIDAGLTRTFNIRERQSLEFRAEAFNVPNHVNLGLPVSTLTSSTFGQIQSAEDPRIMQLALKYVF